MALTNPVQQWKGFMSEAMGRGNSDLAIVTGKKKPRAGEFRCVFMMHGGCGGKKARLYGKHCVWGDRVVAASSSRSSAPHFGT
jgi:hypothetical protein